MSFYSAKYLRKGTTFSRNRKTFFAIFANSSVVPFGIHEVVGGDAPVERARLLGVDIFDEFCRRATPKFAGSDYGAAEHHGTGCDYGSGAYNGIVHHHGAHANEGVVMDLAAVEGNVMAYGDVVADFDGRLLVERVEHGAVLDIHAVADANGVDVAAEHGVKPYGALIADRKVADECGIFSNEAVAAHPGSEAAHGDDQRHSGSVLEMSHERRSSSWSSGRSTSRTLAW